MLQEEKGREAQERMEVARWICFKIYQQNPYIKPPKAQTPQSYNRFHWEGMNPEEVNARKESCHVTPEEQAELDRIFNEIFGKL